MPEMTQEQIDQLFDKVVGDEGGGAPQDPPSLQPPAESPAEQLPGVGTKDILDDDALWARIQSHPRLTKALEQYTEQVGNHRDTEWMQFAEQLGLTAEMKKRQESLSKGEKYWEKSQEAGAKANELHAQAAATGDPRIEALAKKVDGVSAYLAKQAQQAQLQAQKASEDKVLADVRAALSPIVKGKGSDYSEAAERFVLRRANGDLQAGRPIQAFSVYANEFPQYVAKVYGAAAPATQTRVVPHTNAVAGETPEQRIARLEREISARLINE